MRTTIWTIVAILCLTAPAAGQSPGSFGTAKRLLAQIHAETGHLQTLYCGCPYARRGHSGGNVYRVACGLRARKNEKRAGRVEWEHVVPASWFGKNRACWQQGHALCRKKNGKPYAGRRCCLKSGVDRTFVAIHNDPHNLFPATGEVNGDRSAHPFGEVAGEPRQYGLCDFEVGGRPRVAEPAQSVRGEIARAMLYMAHRYGVDVRMTAGQLTAWSREDPPDGWEIERARRIEAATGLRNPFIESR